MGLFSSLLGIIGFGIGFPAGLIIGFYFFIYSEPEDIEDPIIKPLYELDTTALQDLKPEIPLWVKSPDYDRVDWLNKFILDLWPFLDKAICSMIKTTTKPIFEEYIGKFKIEAIEFEKLTLGTLPPTLQGIKVCETNDKELVIEPSIKWGGNPNIVMALTVSSFRITVQLVDLQISIEPRVTLKPLVPTLPCFGKIALSLMKKPHVDFGVKVLGGDFMAIPGLYRYVQKTIKKQVALLYLWPQFHDIPILDASTMAKKPVGILHVKIVRAMKLLKMDLLGLSDPYVKLSLSGETLPVKKTTVKKKTLNPEWNEHFKLIVKDPHSQFLNINVYDWDKVGKHDRIGMQIYPLKMLKPNEPKELTLDLLKSTDISDSQNKKQRGQIVVELTYGPFREENHSFSGPLIKKESGISSTMSFEESLDGAGLLSVGIQGAEDVEGVYHTNPYVIIHYKGEQKRSKAIRRNRNPKWDEEFQFMLEEPPLNEKIRLEVLSKRTGIGFRSKETLGHVDISLNDVVHNGRINHKYHLIDSKNGMIHVELRWKPI